jgi:hypothetical protein
MESMIEFLGLMTITALSVSLALLLEWLLLQVVFRALSTQEQAGGTQPHPSPPTCSAHQGE